MIFSAGWQIIKYLRFLVKLAVSLYQKDFYIYGYTFRLFKEVIEKVSSG